MDILDLLVICDSYSRLGWAITSQLQGYVNEGQALEDLNRNALKDIARFLQDAERLDVINADEYRDAIVRYLRSGNE